MEDTPGRVLVVTPHPDDAEGWCVGAVARWIGEGAEALYVLCTDGGKGSNDPHMTPEKLAPIRDREQKEAAAAVGVREVVTLGLPDGELEDTREFRKELVRAIRRFRPDVVLCPDPYRRSSYWHRDHRITGQVTADATFPYARDHLHLPELYREEGLEPHKAGAILFWAADAPDTTIDITGSIELKIQALLCHKSQVLTGDRGPEQVGEGVRERARQAAEGSGFQYAEAFRKVEFRR